MKLGNTSVLQTTWKIKTIPKICYLCFNVDEVSVGTAYIQYDCTTEFCLGSLVDFGLS